MTYSEDGQHWWNGSEWIPADQAPQAEAAPAAAAPAAAVPAASGNPLYAHDNLEVKQRIRSFLKFGQQYDIYASGSETPSGYAHRGFNLPFMACDMVIYSDESKSTELLRAKQKNGFDAWGSFDILDSQTGEHIATYTRKYWASVLQRKWLVTKPDGSPWFMIQEDGIVKSILRRITPQIVHIVLRTNMNFRTMDGMTDFGAFNRKFSIRDRYELVRNAAELDGRLLWMTGPLLDNASGR